MYEGEGLYNFSSMESVVISAIHVPPELEMDLSYRQFLFFQVSTVHGA